MRIAVSATSIHRGHAIGIVLLMFAGSALTLSAPARSYDFDSQFGQIRGKYGAMFKINNDRN